MYGNVLLRPTTPQCSSIPLRCIHSVRFHTRLEKTSPSVQCVAHGRSPYGKSQPLNCFHASMKQFPACLFPHCSLPT